MIPVWLFGFRSILNLLENAIIISNFIFKAHRKMSDNHDRPDHATYIRHLIEDFKAREHEREQAEKGLTPEQLQTKHENERLPTQRELLRRHVGLPGTPGGPFPPVPENVARFFIEVAAGRATCKLPTCRRFIEPGDYRMALNPAMALENWRRGRLESVGRSCTR